MMELQIAQNPHLADHKDQRLLIDLLKKEMDVDSEALSPELDKEAFDRLRAKLKQQTGTVRAK